MALMPYLILDGLGTYCFRRVIPAELRPFMPEPWTGKANWKQSRGTKDPAAAKKSGSRLLRDCMADFEQAERTKRGEIPAAPARPAAAMLRPEEIEADVVAERLAADAGTEHLWLAPVVAQTPSASRARAAAIAPITGPATGIRA